uniref:Metastriate one of each protein family n=1 Tax=Rhipicephalus zambeziensis TaxID=60191 RepID=A0A224YKN6_9ACAR
MRTKYGYRGSISQNCPRLLKKSKTISLFILRLLMTVELAVADDSPESMTGLEYLFKHLSSCSAKLELPSREFTLNVTKNSGGKKPKTVGFKLTNGKLLQKSGAEKTEGSPNNCEYRSDDAISCYISILGWHAIYEGEIKHAKLGNANFTLNITITKWDLPQNPADIWIYMKFTENSTDRYTATTPSDFVPVPTAQPAFENLNMFENRPKLPKKAWAALNKTIWREIKFDLMDAMMTKYNVSVQKEILYY